MLTVLFWIGVALTVVLIVGELPLTALLSVLFWCGVALVAYILYSANEHWKSQAEKRRLERPEGSEPLRWINRRPR